MSAEVKVWPESDDPAVLAIVEHFVNEGFDPDGAEYVEIAMTALMGLYVAGFTVTPWPSSKGSEDPIPPGTVCGAFGCDQPAVLRTLRGDEWFPGWYCEAHGKGSSSVSAPARTSSTHTES